MSFDVQAFRRAFPLLQQVENQHLVYLDNAATTHKPQCVIDAVSQFYLTANGNAQRASHRLARRATEIVERVRQQAAVFLGAESAGEMVFTHGATEGLNIVAQGLRSRLQRGDEILLTQAEHHANLVPWQQVANSCGARLRFISQPLSTLEIPASAPVKVIAVTVASNSLGQLTDLEGLAGYRRRFPRAVIVVDASQWLAHQPVDVRCWPCDFLVCSAHKFYGPMGVGLLYGRAELLASLPPLLSGGAMVKTVTEAESTFMDAPARFEAGTANIAAIAGLGACFDFWAQQDRTAMAAHEQSLNQLLHRQLQQLCADYPSLRLLTKPAHNIGIATLTANAPYSVVDLGLWLDEQDIAVRVGDHCTQPLWQFLAVQHSVRLSLAAYNTEAEIQEVLKAIRAYCECLSTPALRASEPLSENYSQLPWQQLLVSRRWQARYQLLLQWGRAMEAQPQIRTEVHLVQGCESAAWLAHRPQGQKHYFCIDSDANVVKGLAAVFLCRIHGKTTAEIKAIDFPQYFIDLGLEKHLSPSRVNGFHALFQAALAKVAEV
ncbi:MAG: aminotransferase class V-fold PLP-dependent enzyme [Cellvibrionaceae bacterium]|nr:aminotransferase class V-fold PLP-dependent enzyme [Cellvibrionaceae bacterium]